MKQRGCIILLILLLTVMMSGQNTFEAMGQNDYTSTSLDGGKNNRHNLDTEMIKPNTLTEGRSDLQPLVVVPDFDQDGRVGVAPFTVQFTDLSAGNGVNEWSWDFNGDGTADSNLQNPQYTYNNAGTYTVSLTVNDLDNNPITITKRNYILVRDEAFLPGTLAFDVRGMQAGPPSNNWSFDQDPTPFIQGPNYWDGIYAFQQFNWNTDGRGDGSQNGNPDPPGTGPGSGVMTTLSTIYANNVLVDDLDEVDLVFTGLNLTFFEHINTVDPAQPWDIMGQAGDHRIYDNGYATLYYDGIAVMEFDNIELDIIVHYPAPLGDGGLVGYGIIQGVSSIDAANSDADWVAIMDPTNSGSMQFNCNTADPVVQSYYGTYDMPVVLLEPMGGPYPQIGWANLQWPLATITQTNVATENIFGQVWIDGVTSDAGAAEGLMAQAGYGAPGSDPAEGWTWVDAVFNADAGNNDEYMGQLTVGEAGVYDYTYRYSYLGGNWYYAQERGALTVNAVQDFAEVTFVVDMAWQELAGNFDPAEDFVDVAGNFNEWNGSGAMTDLQNGWYEYTIELEVGFNCEYKYRLNGSWDTAELPDQGNRVLEVPSGGTTVNDIYDNWEPEIGFAELMDPFQITITAGEETPPIYGQLYIEGLTEGDAIAPLVQAQVGYGNGEMTGWDWYDTEFFQNVNNNDEYVGSFTVGEPGDYNHSYRFRFNFGEWVYGASIGFMTVQPVQIPELIINEINAFSDEDDVGPDEDYEFIEIYNPGMVGLDLSGCSIAGSVSYDFEGYVMIESEDYLVIARNPDLLSNVYNLNNVVGPFTGELPDDTGTVILQTETQEIIDEVDYDTEWYFASEYGWGSLELRNPDMDNSEEESWCASYGSMWDEALMHYGGTPGVINLHYYSIYDVQYPGDMHSEKVHEMVECTGIITARFFGNNVQRYVIQVPEFLWDTYEYSGVFVYANEWLEFEEGDMITVTGLVTENSPGTSDTVIDPWNIELQSSGNELPDPVFIDLLDADERTDEWEGVLITTCGNCSNDNEDGSMWFLTDGLWTAVVAGDDDEHASAPAGSIIEGNDYTVRGIIEGYEIWMRTEDDWNEGMYTLPGVITGTVTAEGTEEPIEGALITAAIPDRETEYTAETNADGIFFMEVPASNYYVSCAAVGYEDAEAQFVILDEEETEVVDFVLVAGNMPPELNLPGVFGFNEDETLIIDINDYASDPEDDPLTVWIEGNVNIQAEANGSEVTLSAPADWNGMEEVTFFVSDGQERSVVSELQTIEVYFVNDAPWLDLPEMLTINIAEDEIPYLFDFSEYCGDVDGDYLWASAISDPEIAADITDLTVEITPQEGFTGNAELTITVEDLELNATDMIIVNVIDQPGAGEIVFDIFGLEAGPADLSTWMFDSDGTPFIHDGGIYSNYAYSAFNWNSDGHGDGTCPSGGSGVVTDQIGVSENLPFVDNAEDMSIFINGFDLTFFEHINTENPQQPWDTMGEAGDHREYTGGMGEIFHNGDIVLFVDDVIFDVTTYYPQPVGNGGATGYGTVEGQGVIDAVGSDPQWVEHFDPSGTGLIYFQCGSMSPVLQECYGTYDVDDLVIYGNEQQQNQPPVIDLPEEFVFDEDGMLEIDFSDYAFDLDNDPLTLSIMNNYFVNVDIDGMVVTFTAEENWNGSEFIIVTVDDGQDTASDNADVIVNPVNDVPWIDLPEEIVINTAIDPIPYLFDIADYYGDVDDFDLTLSVNDPASLNINIDGSILEITPDQGFTGIDMLTVTVSDPQELENSDTMSINIIDEEVGEAEIVFDIFGLEAGPADWNTWMFDSDGTPFIQDGGINSNYAYSAFNWNSDGHGDGTCPSGGSGVITDEIGVSENLPFVDNAEDMSIFINGFDLTFFEHINTENPQQPWDTMGEAGDHREYTGGMGEIFHNGDIVLFVDDVIFDVTTYYPQPVGNGGATGYGTVEGQGIIDAVGSDPQWVEHFDPAGTGLIYFHCGSMSPVLQECYGTYDVDDLVIYGNEDINNAPVFYLPQQFTFDEDASLTEDMMDYAVDVDNDPLTVTVEGNENIIVAIDGTNVTFSAPENWNGSEILTITVNDNQSRATASDDVEVVVNPINDAPWIDLPEEITIDTEIDPLPYEFDVSPYCGDVDNENLIISAISSPDISVTIEGLMLYIDLVDMQSTLATLTVTVYDEAFLNSSDMMNVNIIAENPITSIYGWVTDENTFMPVENVEISLTESPQRRMTREEMMNRPSYTVYTDPGGYYELELDPGFYDLNATHPDYEAVSAGNIEIIEFTNMEYSFTMLYMPAGYVTTGLYTVGCEYGDGFTDFVLGDLVNIDSGCSTDGIGYGDFTELSDTFYAGENVDLSMQGGYSSNYARIWVDFDQDFAFSEDEMILDATLLYQNVPVDVIITIPEYAEPGEYRMRARTVYMNQNFDASSQYQWGEVEDYTLIVTDEQPPELNIQLPVSFQMDEDYPEDFDLVPYITGENYVVTYEGSEHIDITLNGMTATFTPAPDFFGAESVTFTVSDETSRTILSDDMLVEVMPINDPPVIDLPMEIEISTVSNNLPYGMGIGQYIYDIEDEDELLVTSFSCDPNLGLTANGFNLAFDPPQAYNGWFSLTVNVMDSEGATAFDNLNIHVTTEPATAIYGWITEMDTETPLADVEARVQDPETNDILFQTFTDEYGYFYMDVDPGDYTGFIMKDGYLGYYLEDFALEDGEILEFSYEMGIFQNHYPSENMYVFGCQEGDYIDNFEFGTISNLNSGCSDDEIGYGIFTDMITDVTALEEYTMTVTAQHDNCWFRAWIDLNDGYHMYNPEELVAGPFLLEEAGVSYDIPVSIPFFGEEGEHLMRIRIVRDVEDFGCYGIQQYGEIEDYLVNYSFPELTLDLPDEGINFDEDTTFDLDLNDYATGLDYDVSWSGNENILISILDNVLNFNPYPDWYGTENVVITLDDGISRTTVSDTLTVTVNPVNDAPYIDMPTQLSFYTYGPKVRDISSYFGDVDGDALTLTVTGNDSIEVEVLGSTIHLLVEDGWTGTDTWTITVDDGVSRETAYDIVNIQVGDALILTLDGALPAEEWGTGCFDFSEEGADLSVIPPAGDGWECNGTNDPSWYFYPGEISLTPGRLYVNLANFDLHWFQVDVTLTDNCGIGCTEVTATMGQNTFMTNYNTESFVETNVTILNGMGNDFDGFYISTLEATVHEIHVYFADQNPTYIGGHITDSITELPLEGVEITAADIFDSTMVYTTGTGADGNYYVEVEPSTYDLTYECQGYETVYYYDVTLADGDFVDYSFAMIPETAEVTLNRDLAAGWNWISLNLECEDMGIDAILNSLGENGTSIKNQSSTALYYTGIGWIGSMTEFDLTSLYKIQMNSDAPWEITGIPVIPAEYPIELAAGWNWISFLPQYPVEINTALASIEDNGINIKNSSQIATYYTGAGWFGTLEYLDPLYGYMLDMENPATLIYPDNVARIDTDLSAKEESSIQENRWQINHHDYEFNGSVIAHIDGMQQGDQIAVFSNDECRGCGQVLDYSEHFGHLTFVLMAYTNEVDGEEMTFRYYDQSEDTEFALKEKLYFTPDAVIGDFAQPLTLTLPDGNSSDLPLATKLGNCTPNPFNPSGTIGYQLSEPAQVEIDVYNVRGQKVASLVDMWQESGTHSVQWNGKDQFGKDTASGIYFVKMKAGMYKDMNRIILLK